MTDAQKVAIDAMRSAWPEDVVARMLSPTMFVAFARGDGCVGVHATRDGAQEAVQRMYNDRIHKQPLEWREAVIAGGEPMESPWAGEWQTTEDDYDAYGIVYEMKIDAQPPFPLSPAETPAAASAHRPAETCWSCGNEVSRGECDACRRGVSASAICAACSGTGEGPVVRADQDGAMEWDECEACEGLGRTYPGVGTTPAPGPRHDENRDS